jgi:hypothetical protein
MDNGMVPRMNRGFGFLISDLAILKKHGVFSTVAIGDISYISKDALLVSSLLRAVYFCLRGSV